MSDLYSDKVYALASEIAQDLMQTEPSIGVDFKKLRALIREERQQELDDVMPSDHPHILEDFAADAGYLVGLEVGKRLAGGARVKAAEPSGDEEVV